MKNQTRWYESSGQGETSHDNEGVVRTTEAGVTRVTEAGTTRTLEDTTHTPKAATPWSLELIYEYLTTDDGYFITTDDGYLIIVGGGIYSKEQTPWHFSSGLGESSNSNYSIERTTEAGTTRTTESGITRTLEDTVYTPKSNTAWEASDT